MKRKKAIRLLVVYLTNLDAKLNNVARMIELISSISADNERDRLYPVTCSIIGQTDEGKPIHLAATEYVRMGSSVNIRLTSQIPVENGILVCFGGQLINCYVGVESQSVGMGAGLYTLLKPFWPGVEVNATVQVGK